jgi:hypothetical protein
MRCSFVLAACAVTPTLAAVPADQVTNLPGFGAPLSPLYSGYLVAAADQRLHYVFSAAISADPSTAPLALWFNGGPGCSSMEGLLSESGPYRVVQFSDPVTLTFNSFTWNSKTNNLWLESPAGVGFSYCETARGCDNTDTNTAANNLLALLSFYEAFPEFRANPLWITGESYAGIYIPMLAYNVYNYNVANPSTPVNLHGIMVGNGCIGNNAGHCGNDALNDYHDVLTFRGHGLISQKLFDTILKECDWNAPSLICDALLLEANLLTAGLDVYDLYNTCSDPASPPPPLRAPVGNRTAIARLRAHAAANPAARARLSASASAPLDPNCFGSGPTIESWANQAAVKQALHVAPAIDFALCSGNFTFNYNSDMPDERVVIYPTLLTKANITVVIFNGEADLCVPFTDNECEPTIARTR